MDSPNCKTELGRKTEQLQKKSIFYDFKCQFISIQNAILGHKGALSSAIASDFNVYKTQKTTKCMIQMKA